MAVYREGRDLIKEVAELLEIENPNEILKLSVVFERNGAVVVNTERFTTETAIERLKNWLKSKTLPVFEVRP